MNVTVGKRWEAFVAGLVAEGRYASSSDVVRDGLQLIQEREAKLEALRSMLDASIAKGGPVAPDEVAALLDARTRELKTGSR